MLTERISQTYQPKISLIKGASLRPKSDALNPQQLYGEHSLEQTLIIPFYMHTIHSIHLINPLGAFKRQKLLKLKSSFHADPKVVYKAFLLTLTFFPSSCFPSLPFPSLYHNLYISLNSQFSPSFIKKFNCYTTFEIHAKRAFQIWNLLKYFLLKNALMFFSVFGHKYAIFKFFPGMVNLCHM